MIYLSEGTQQVVARLEFGVKTSLLCRSFSQSSLLPQVGGDERHTA